MMITIDLTPEEFRLVQDAVLFNLVAVKQGSWPEKLDEPVFQKLHEKLVEIEYKQYERTN